MTKIAVLLAGLLAALSSASAAVSFGVPLQGREPLPSFPTAIGPVVADVNGDGKADIVTADFNTSSIFISLGKADGSPLANTIIVGPNQPSAMHGADLNGDGKHDLIFSADAKVGYVLNSSGSFGAFRALPLPQGYPDFLRASVGAADFNGDGFPDIVASGTGADFFTGQPTGLIVIYLSTNDAGGSFTGFSAPQVFGGGKVGGRLAVGDLNGDGFPDVAVATRPPTGNAEVAIRFGDPLGAQNGTPLLVDPQSVNLSKPPVGIAIGDITGDGKAEIVVSSYVLDAANGTVASWVDVLREGQPFFGQRLFFEEQGF